jgi:hypothetical protein
MLSQPAGTTLCSISGATLRMAMMPTANEAMERMKNCTTSVMTTLIMPPLIT